MTSASEIPWKRISVEAVAIVGSILLAFAIDAWWEKRQEQDADTKQLDRVSAELEANADRIQRKLETLSVAIDATSMVLSWMGPQPESVPDRNLFNQWVNLSSIGSFSLLRNASENYLAAGDIDSAESVNIRYAVSEWYTYGDDLEKQYELLRVAHAALGVYSQDIIPRLREIQLVPIMQGHPTSKFPYDQTAVLSDPKMESRLAIYLLRLEFVSRQARDLQTRHERLQAMIDLATEK